MSSCDHPSALELAAALGSTETRRSTETPGFTGTQRADGPDPSIVEHLAACVACRVRAARLWHELLPGDPDEDAISRVLAASSPGPSILATFSAERDAGPPRPGEIWRIGRDEPILGWVRRVFNDAIDIIPVVLDIELADQESVFVAAQSTPLAMPLALLTGIRGHVSPRAMLQRIGYVHAFAQVREVMAAAAEGRMPDGVAVGPPIDHDDDQRIEYRQVIADLLADLAPDAWEDDGPRGAIFPGREVADIRELLAARVPFWNSGARVLPMPMHQELLGGGISLFACARVTYLDTSLVVAVLSGASLDEVLSLDEALSPGEALSLDEALSREGPLSLPGACLNLTRLEPDAAAIAIAGTGADWPAVVLKVADLRTAYETPTGRLASPRIAREPLPVIDAVAKFLDNQLPAWEVTEPVTTRIAGIDIEALAGRSAAEAVADIAAQGRRARTPAKKSAWARLPGSLEARLAQSITALLSGEPVDHVLDDLTGHHPTEGRADT